MTATNPIVDAPGGFAPEHAIAFGTAGATAIPVDDTHPLPTRTTLVAAAATPLAGSTAASGVFGPFTPDLGRPIWVTLSGSWTGSVTVLRSTDGGTTKLPLTVGGQPWATFTANANEAIGEDSVAGAGWYLQATLGGGTLAYGIRQ